MKLRLFVLVVVLAGTALGNQTRMNTLMADDYLDDPVGIGRFPHHLALYGNRFYGDIHPGRDDFGIVVALPAVGNLGIFADSALWCGYGVTVKRFDVGFVISPRSDYGQYGLGVGRTHFASRWDISFLASDAANDERFELRARWLKRAGDHVIVPRYAWRQIDVPYEATEHQLGILVQRLVLEQGLVYLAATGHAWSGALSQDHMTLSAGFELPVSRFVVARLGCREQLDDEGNPSGLLVEPGIGVRIREFGFDLHLNKDRLFDREPTCIKSIGLDLDFGRF